MDPTEAIVTLGGKCGGAQGAKATLTVLPDDADFRALIGALADEWPTVAPALKPALKAGILAMVKAATEK